MLKHLVISMSALVVLASCASSKKAAYFNEQKDGTLENTSVIPETYIQKNDILSITVSSANPGATEVFNAPLIPYATPIASNGTSAQASGYLVDAGGNIQFPMLGTMKVAGLTGEQLREKIVGVLLSKKLLVDPIVNVRYLNFKVTVLGEVAHPTVVNVPNEKITILEALGLAGDLTIYGRRDNVMVIREENNQKTIRRLNLNTSEVFSSPYYYLKSSDIVYVEPNKAKVSNSGRGAVLLPVIFSGLSFAAIVVDRLTR